MIGAAGRSDRGDPRRLVEARLPAHVRGGRRAHRDPLRPRRSRRASPRSTARGSRRWRRWRGLTGSPRRPVEADENALTVCVGRRFPGPRHRRLGSTPRRRAAPRGKRRGRRGECPRRRRDRAPVRRAFHRPASAPSTGRWPSASARGSGFSAPRAAASRRCSSRSSTGSSADATVVALVGERGPRSGTLARRGSTRGRPSSARRAIAARPSDCARPKLRSRSRRAAPARFGRAAGARQPRARRRRRPRRRASLRGEPVGRGGYPRQRVQLLAQLLERAGAVRPRFDHARRHGPRRRGRRARSGQRGLPCGARRPHRAQRPARAARAGFRLSTSRQRQPDDGRRRLARASRGGTCASAAVAVLDETREARGFGLDPGPAILPYAGPSPPKRRSPLSSPSSAGRSGRRRSGTWYRLADMLSDGYPR